MGYTAPKSKPSYSILSLALVRVKLTIDNANFINVLSLLKYKQVFKCISNDQNRKQGHTSTSTQMTVSLSCFSNSKRGVSLPPPHSFHSIRSKRESIHNLNCHSSESNGSGGGNVVVVLETALCDQTEVWLLSLPLR